LRHREATRALNEQIYFPLAQAPRHPLVYLVKTNEDDPAALAPAVRDAVRRVAPSMPVFAMRPLAAYVDEARATHRFVMLLGGAFAVTALLLACIGVYGTVSYAVALRRQEFGIRLALGARPGQVRRLVLGEAARLAVWGLAVGVTGAAAAGTLLRHQLIDVSPRDPASYAVATGVLAAAVLLAALLPLRRVEHEAAIVALKSDVC
jgi:putative ABC transport system permease protein